MRRRFSGGKLGTISAAQTGLQHVFPHLDGTVDIAGVNQQTVKPVLMEILQNQSALCNRINIIQQANCDFTRVLLSTLELF